jgi:hypothetical protein
MNINEEGYVESIKSLVQFLQSNGFSLTAETLIGEVEARISSEAGDAGQEAHEDASPAPADAEISEEPAARCVGVSPEAQPQPSPSSPRRGALKPCPTCREPEPPVADGSALPSPSSAIVTSLTLQRIYSTQGGIHAQLDSVRRPQARPARPPLAVAGGPSRIPRAAQPS